MTMTNYQQAIEQYLEALDQSNLEGILALFDMEGYVESPFLGRMKADEFFAKVMASSTESNITVYDILVSAHDRPRAVGYFRYDWTLADETKVTFDCADIFEFTAEGKFKEMKIMYDTHPIRSSVGDKYQ